MENNLIQSISAIDGMAVEAAPAPPSSRRPPPPVSILSHPLLSPQNTHPPHLPPAGRAWWRWKGAGVASPASCTEEVRRAWRVKPILKTAQARRFILDLLLSTTAPTASPAPRTARTGSRTTAGEYGVEHTSYQGKRVDAPKMYPAPSSITDPNLCIMCRKCERTCSPSVPETISIRAGASTRLAIPFGRRWKDSSCEGCGSCVAACPTGALSPPGA